MSFNPSGGGISSATDVALSNPSANQFLMYNSGIGKWQNQAISVPDEAFTYSNQGTIAVGTGVGRQYLDTNYTIDTVRASVGTAPTGASIIIDVKKNGTSVYSGTPSNRPTIAANGFTAVGGTPTTASLASGDYITIDIVQVGSTIAGTDLVVTVRLKKN